MLVLGGAPAAFWLLLQRKPVPKPPSPSVVSPTPSPGDEYAFLEKFVGEWIVEEMDEDAVDSAIIVLRRQGDEIVSVPAPGEPDFRLAPHEGEELKGEVDFPGEGTVPIFAQVSLGASKLEITLAPPDSEYYTITAWRFEPTDPDFDTNRLPPDERPRTSTLTATEAVRMVRELPEVREWLAAIDEAINEGRQTTPPLRD